MTPRSFRAGRAPSAISSKISASLIPIAAAAARGREAKRIG